MQQDMQHSAYSISCIGVWKELFAFTLQYDILTSQSLLDELRRGFAITHQHGRTKHTTQSYYFYLNTSLSDIRLTKSFAQSLRLWITSTCIGQIQFACIVLSEIIIITSITIHLNCWRIKHHSTTSQSFLKRLFCTFHIDIDGLNRVLWISQRMRIRCQRNNHIYVGQV